MLERLAQLRPSWLFAGGAMIGVLALCGVVALCGAVVLIWSSTQGTPPTPEPTSITVIQRPTEPPTRTTAPLPASVTPLPVVSSPQALPTAIALVTPNPGSSLTPDQAVRNYYQLISEHRYDLTWPLLTEAFKQKFNCCAPNYNYNGYINWWDSVARVEFGSVRTVSQSGNQAVVYAELYYVMHNGARSSLDSDPYIQLIFDATAGIWRFDDKRSAA